MIPQRPAPLDAQLQRWRQAGLIDAATSEAILGWEATRPQARTLTLPVRLALSLGSILLAAGLLLFVSAHWDALAPAGRFALVLAVVVALHGLAAAAATAQPWLATALHGVGSVGFGAGVFLSGQIFHLQAHWPLGLLLWSLGNAAGWLLLRQWPQLALLALTLPAWLCSEWVLLALRVSDGRSDGMLAASLALTGGLLLLSLSYLGAARGSPISPPRQVLVWVGGLTLLPAATAWALVSNVSPGDVSRLPAGPLLLGWSAALAAPLLLGWRLQGPRTWPLAVAIGWLLVNLQLPLASNPFSYAWWAVGGVLLSLWGSRDGRAERINLGALFVALSLIGFYFSQVMERLDRSVSLVGLGVLFLVGGWLLERWRRRLTSRLPGGAASLATQTGDAGHNSDGGQR